MKNCDEILMDIALDLQIAFGNIAIFIMLILAIQIFPFYGVFFNFFLRDLKFLSYRPFTFLPRVNQRYFMLFVGILKADVSLISFLAHLSFVCSSVSDFFFLKR